MNKTYNEKFNETVYTETLDNGLNITIFYKPDFISSSAIFATPYGSLDAKQTLNGEEFSVHYGAAHFLEHKLFEDEDKDIFRVFSSMGANVNAFTSYGETAYYFSSAESDIRKPLETLLDFVQELKIDKKSVNKEKGIITQELMMYKQMPDMRLFQEILQAMYKDHPIFMDIGGRSQDVKKTTVEELYQAYNLNYHPANMQLIVVTNQNPDEIIDLVKTNQSKKSFNAFIKPERYKYDEPQKTRKRKVEIEMDVHKQKVALGFKLEKVKGDNLHRERVEWALKYLLDAYFSSINPIFQKWIDNKIITDYFSYEVDIDKDYSLLIFSNETDSPKEFRKLITNRIKKINPSNLSEKVINQLKNRYYGAALLLMDNPDDLAISYMRSKFKNIDFFESLQLPQDISLNDLNEAKELLDTTNYSLVTIKSVK